MVHQAINPPPSDAIETVIVILRHLDPPPNLVSQPHSRASQPNRGPHVYVGVLYMKHVPDVPERTFLQWPPFRVTIVA